MFPGHVHSRLAPEMTTSVSLCGENCMCWFCFCCSCTDTKRCELLITTPCSLKKVLPILSAGHEVCYRAKFSYGIIEFGVIVCGWCKDSPN